MGALERNVAGTRQANARAQAASRPKVEGRGKMHQPKQKGPSSEAITRRRRAKGVGAGYGGMGYGPTAGGSRALDKAKERADPGRLIRDAVSAMSGPKTVRATGSIWDDPNYAAMANEHGAEFAMRARNLDQKINSAKAYQQGRMESMQTQFGMEKMKRDNARDQMAFKQEAATYGSPDDISQAYGAGAYKDEQGNIIQPGAQQTDPETGLAVDEEGAFTGREPGGSKKVGEAPLNEREVREAETQTAAAERTKELDIERIKGLSESLAAAIEARDTKMVNKILKQMQGSGQGGGDSTHVSKPQNAEELRARLIGSQPDEVKDEDGNILPEYQDAFEKVYQKNLQRFGFNQ